ncbi:thiamine pyrophosphate-requiring protein [Mumia quercus]|uniref:thiamine pyrophosphate-requiring protein n=1 Tax=Mumia quercus TaxID=2976125 RepID=UPI0021CEA3F4|nr:thiamine pyrophosphate-requiring protein [Mumia quercus]
MTDETLVSDFVVERLRAWGVARVFGYSGDGINPFMGALRRAAGDPEFVQARHEENAALMAVGHAKYTGGVGVVTSTQGPGAVHLLNGLYDAKLDHVPVVAIVGQQQTTVLGSEYQQEIDLALMFADVARDFCQTVMSPEQVPVVLDRAFRTARDRRSPCVVVLPHDVQKATLPEEPPHEHGVTVSAPTWSDSHLLPTDADLDAAAEVLDAGERVAVLVGQGARDAGDEVRAIAEKLGAGVTTSLLGKPWWDETLPLSCGVMGHLGTTASGWLMGHCDTLLIIGSDDPWTEFYPPPGAARAVQIDIDGRNLGHRYPITAGVHGDARQALRALLPRVREREQDAPWRHEVEEQVTRWRAVRDRRAARRTDPLNPETVVHALSSRLPGDALVSVDVGSITYWYARHLILPPGVPAHLSSTLASMGSGLPYGLAAKLADPSRPVVALVGDGAMQMNGINELVTVSRLWPQWADSRFVVLVLANGDLSEVTWEQRETEAEPRYEASQALPAFPYAGYADLLGLHGIRVTVADEVDAAWERALSADRPTVIEAVVDRDAPLLPPFPGGEEKLDSFRRGLEQEGPDGERALGLLEQQAGDES